MVSAVIVLGLAGSVPDIVDNTRTQAGQVAAALARTSQPGDVVAYCPDQLGPAVSRLAPPGLVQATYPRYGDSRMVDWVDYEQRNRSASPRAFADGVLARAQGHELFLVWAAGYRTYGSSCETVARYLRERRPAGGELVHADGEFTEFASLDRYVAR